MSDLRIKIYSVEQEEAEKFLKSILFDGFVDMHHPLFVFWCKTHNQQFDLLTYSTIFPQWLAASIIFKD